MSTGSAQQPIAALVVAQPGHLRDALCTLLRAIPCVGNIWEADDFASALRVSVHYRPLLVVCDITLWRDEAQGFLQRLKVQLPQLRSVALVESDDMHAHELGADTVLVKGTLATRMLSAIEHTLAN